MKPRTELPLLERTLDMTYLVAYAGATWDWYGTHYDPAAIAAAGLPGPLVDGQMLGALLAEQALDAAGPGAQVRRMGFRFRSMVFAGDTVRVEGSVVSVAGQRIRLAQRILVGERLAVEPAWTELDVP
ncbi:MAG TPA: MaoC/PaaZ C-terminal domain-containing protein [Candidatus Dormibacteraeota bacterium]|nr:MaoC/PaaZ C-terminal domain-containing protein [Candidatus Dormibacteraeota bacterium]